MISLQLAANQLDRSSAAKSAYICKTITMTHEHAPHGGGA